MNKCFKKKNIKILWKDTRKAGFSYATSKSGFVYVVAFYFPAGNIKGKFKENVLGIANDSSTTTNATMQMQKSFPPGEVVVSLDQLQNRFIQEALQAHNYYRQLHGVDKVKMFALFTQENHSKKFIIFYS